MNKNRTVVLLSVLLMGFGLSNSVVANGDSVVVKTTCKMIMKNIKKSIGKEASQIKNRLLEVRSQVAALSGSKVDVVSKLSKKMDTTLQTPVVHAGATKTQVATDLLSRKMKHALLSFVLGDATSLETYTRLLGGYSKAEFKALGKKEKLARNEYKKLMKLAKHGDKKFNAKLSVYNFGFANDADKTFVKAKLNEKIEAYKNEKGILGNKSYRVLKVNHLKAVLAKLS